MRRRAFYCLSENSSLLKFFCASIYFVSIGPFVTGDDQPIATQCRSDQVDDYVSLNTTVSSSNLISFSLCSFFCSHKMKHY